MNSSWLLGGGQQAWGDRIRKICAVGSWRPRTFGYDLKPFSLSEDCTRATKVKKRPTMRELVLRVFIPMTRVGVFCWASSRNRRTSLGVQG
jgi:hypothetical protein